MYNEISAHIAIYLIIKRGAFIVCYSVVGSILAACGEQHFLEKI